MIIAYAKSDVGKVREMNQDAYYISDSSSEVKLYLLADGMGGYKGESWRSLVGDGVSSE